MIKYFKQDTNKYIIELSEDKNKIADGHENGME